MVKTLPPERIVARAETLARKGDADGARNLLIDAARRFPKNKRLKKALLALDLPKTTTRDPKLLAKVRLLGSLCESARNAEAIALGRELLAVMPGDPIVMALLGAALVAGEEADKALPLFGAVLQQAPTFARAWSGFGTALTKMDRHHQAVRALNQALDLSPNDIDALNNLGTSLRALNRHEEALECFNHIREVEDGYKVRLNYGTTLLELGRAEEATEALESAIALKPDYCPAHRCLSIVKRYSPGDPHFDAMDALAQSDISDEDRVELAFARAKAFDDIGERARAFAAWSEGNALRQAEIGYDAEAERKRFAVLRRLFRDHALTPLTFDPIRYRPIFVVGMPRSGTSLCEQILSRHPAVWSGGELEDMRHAVSTASTAHGHRLCHDLIRDVRARYVASLDNIGAEPGVVTDKMPANFRFIGFIRLAFPEATVIHMRRDPAAVCWSLFKSFFATRGHGYAYNMEDAAEYFALYHELTTLYEELWPDTIHSVDYDALTEDPERHIRALLDACRLPFDPACLQSHRSTRAVRTVSALQVRSAIYKGSSDVWRRYEKFLAPMLERLAAHGLGPLAAASPPAIPPRSELAAGGQASSLRA